MITLLTILIALIAILLMAAVLIQNPKGGGVDSTFGGSATNQMLGAARSTDFIEKAPNEMDRAKYSAMPL